MNIRNYTIIILILIMSTTIISCNSLRSNEDNEKQELQSVEDNKQLLNEISNIRNILGDYDDPKKDFHMNFDKDPSKTSKGTKGSKK